MNKILLEKLPRIEGDLKVLLSQTEFDREVFLKSGRSTHLGLRLEGKYPLEAVQLTQSLSDKTGVAHAISAVMALEDYLRLYPTESSVRVRQILLDLSCIRSHIFHFYWELLPDYLNNDHYHAFSEEELWFYSGFYLKEQGEGALPTEVGIKIIKNIKAAADALNLLQKCLVLLGGKFPVIMNQIPGGVTNFSISHNLRMKMIRNLELCKNFIETVWPADVKKFIQSIPDATLLLGREPNLISFGSLPLDKNKGKTSNYSEGILLDGKLEPVNELKITESLDNTYYLPTGSLGAAKSVPYDFNKPDARTWIKGARYDGKSVLTGALSRMMVTHLAGGNLEISDKIGQLIDDLELTFETPNCVASRILAEVIESRILLKNTTKNLFEFEDSNGTNRKTYFDFSMEGVGIGKVESPGGSLLHQIFIEDNRIRQYRIISSVNWNFSPVDSEGESGIIEDELNTLWRQKEVSAIDFERLLHSYNAQILDGTQ